MQYTIPLLWLRVRFIGESPHQKEGIADVGVGGMVFCLNIAEFVASLKVARHQLNMLLVVRAAPYRNRFGGEATVGNCDEKGRTGF